MSEKSTQHVSLAELQNATLTATSVIRDEIRDMFATKGLDDPICQTVANLVYFMSDRAQAVLLLTSWSMLWDAEIVLRSFYEAAAKVLFLTLSPAEKRNTLVGEFWTEFDSIHASRRARKAEFALEVPSESQVQRDVFAAFLNPAIWDLSPRHNKAKRKEIEQRWSFPEIMEAISRLDAAAADIRYLKASLHFYGIASHLIHADKSGLEMVADRAMRPEPERSIVAAAQAARIFSDLVNLWMLCAVSISDAFGVSLCNVSAIMGAVGKVDSLVMPFSRMFDDSQAAFYARINRESVERGASAGEAASEAVDS